MSADIIKEFLVGLGFKVDSAQFKKFELGVKMATQVATKLGGAATTAAVAVEGAVVKISKQFEDLYFASQRIHSSVQNIRSMDYEITQMGGSASGARQAMEGIAEFMRSNPGGERFISGLGVSTREANGELRDTAEIMRDLGDRFRAMPYYAAKIRAGMLGMDERTLQALIRGTDEFAARYHDMSAKVGVDQQAAAKASHDFMVQVRDLWVQLELVFGKVILTLQGEAGDGLRRFADVAVRVMTAVGILALRLVTAFGEVDAATGGWATALLILAAVLGPVLALLGPTVLGVIALGAAILALVDDFEVWRAGGKSLIDWSAWSGEIDAAMAAMGDLGTALRSLIELFGLLGAAQDDGMGPARLKGARIFFMVLIDMVDALANSLSLVIHLLTGQWKTAWEDAKRVGHALVDPRLADIASGKEGQGPSAQARARALDQPNSLPSAPLRPPVPQPRQKTAPPSGQQTALGQQAMAYFQSKGWTKEQTAGIVANLAKESGFNTRAVGDGGKAFGIAQWHPDRQANFQKFSGKDIRQSTFAEQLAFVQHELTQGMEKQSGAWLRHAKTAAEAGALISRYYERPKDASGEAALRGRMAENWFARPNVAQNGGGARVDVSQKTDIHVHGVSDPNAAGREVAAQQGRVNGDLLRNTAGALK